jgi:sorting nexin-13
LQRFLDPNTNEDNSVTKVKTANVAVKAVKSVGQAVTSAPGAIINTVDNVVDGIFGKAFQSNHRVPTMLIDSHPYRYGNVDPFSTTVANNTGVIVGTGAAGNTDSVESNIPLRIILLFMDEVFDLQERNQWLRRQIVAVLRQILKAMFGDIVNRRIVDYFAAWTAPSTLASYLRSLKDSLWPNGYPAETKAPRDEATKMRTRIAAKVAMFSSLNDELKRVIGSETSRAGLMMLFDMLQHPVLNKRLTIVLLEAVLDTIFAEQDLPAIFQKLHSRSGRVKNELRNSQRKHSDLRVMGR